MKGQQRTIGALPRRRPVHYQFAGKGHWESHIPGDELIHIIDGTATAEILGVNGPQSFALRAGAIASFRRARHRFHSSDGVTLMTATPFPSKVIELDIDDPRTVERKPM